ncbi:MAG: DUF4105 domain-containing protein [Gemmatimonadota bacterium]
MFKSARLVIASTAALTLNAASAQAQSPAAGADSLTVYLMTMGPGDYVWERFGHNAILIRDARTGQDRVYNWGMFSLDDSGFIWRFLRGRMRYWMASEDALLTIEAYRRANRSVTVQQLNLSSAQKTALQAFVEHNELPENRYYDYDYFRDNCSTRVRDALDKALGGALSQRFRSRITDMTYRDHARRLMQPDIWTYTGIDIGLGRPTDRPISAWEEMFIPMSVQRLVRDVQVTGPDGATVPLVLNERVLFEATRPPTPERPARWTLWYLVAGLLIGAVILVTGVSRAAAIATFLSVTWCLVAGILGSALVFLWLATAHVAAYQNANLLALNPLWLVLGGLVLARSRKARSFALALTALAFVALLFMLMPNAQDTARVLALVLPIHTGVMLAIARRVRLSGV